MESKDFDLITILGPTASGKTRLAVALAKEINGEIISADSRQVYREMDIGTGKDLQEYDGVPYHLIDILDAGQIYGVGQFQLDFNHIFKDIKERGKTPILCGGTGLYIQAVLQNFAHTYIPRNPTMREALDVKDAAELLEIFNELPHSKSFAADTSTHKRLVRAIEIAKWLESNPLMEEVTEPPKSLIFGLEPKLESRRDKISKRLSRRFDGIIEEVQRLLDKGILADMLIFYGLEYKIITLYLLGEFSKEDCFNKLEIAIHQFAKRQMTYFRKMEKDGLEIQWIKETAIKDRLDFIRISLSNL